MALIAMLVNGWHSDKKGERIWHVCVPLATVGLALLLASALDSVPIAAVAVMMFVVGTCMYAHLPAFWPIPTMFLGAATAASAIGFINMFGNLGGFFGPDMVGKSVDQDIRWVSELMGQKEAKPLIGEDATKLDKLVETITESGKLDAQQSEKLNQLLSQVRAGKTLEQSTQEELIQLLNRGASFADALRKIAPWPIMSAMIILLVGAVRKRTASQAKPAVS
jgi:hypothetical protein